MYRVDVGDIVTLNSESNSQDPQKFTVGYLKENGEIVGLYWFDYDLSTLKSSEIPMAAVKKV